MTFSISSKLQDTFCCNGVTKYLDYIKQMAVGVILVKMRAKVFPGKILMNISCKFDNSTL